MKTYAEYVQARFTEPKCAHRKFWDAVIKRVNAGEYAKAITYTKRCTREADDEYADTLLRHCLAITATLIAQHCVGEHERCRMLPKKVAVSVRRHL